MRLRASYIFAGLAIVVALAVAAFAMTLSHTEDCVPAASASEPADGFTAVTYRCYGSPDILELVTLEKPVPAANEKSVPSPMRKVSRVCWR